MHADPLVSLILTQGEIMATRPPSRLIERVPRGFLGMLAILLVTEWIWLARSRDFVEVWSDDWRQTAEAASTGLRDRDVLILGDSLVKFGVLPKQIEARTGLKSYNLALHAGAVPSSYMMLKRALDAGAKPRAIVADFYALMMAEKTQEKVLSYSTIASIGECFEMGREAQSPDLTTKLLLGKLLVSFKSRFVIRVCLMGAFRGERVSAWPAQQNVWTTWKEQQGAQPIPMPSWKFYYDVALHRLLVFDRWEPDPVQVAYIEKFLKLAESKQIPVIWLMPPLSTPVQVVRQECGNDAAYTQFVQSIIARHPTVEVLDARRSGYDESVHIDLLHLDQIGAKVFSNDVADVLAERLLNRNQPDNERWSRLPSLAGRTGDEPARMIARATSEGKQIR